MKKLIFILSLICSPFFTMFSGENNNQEIYQEEVITEEKLSSLESVCGTISKYILYFDALGSGIAALGCFIALADTSFEAQMMHYFYGTPHLAMMGCIANAIFAYKTACVLDHGLKSEPRKIIRRTQYI